MSPVIVQHFMKPVSPASYAPRMPTFAPPKGPSLRNSFNDASSSTGYKPPARNLPPPVLPQQSPQAAPQPEKHAAFDINNMALAKIGTMDFFLRDIAQDSNAAKIMTAAVQGDIGQLRALLQQDDVLPDFTNDNGVTPLMAAAAQGHADVVELLAAHPLVNLGRGTADGWTALHYAAWFGRGDIVHSLLKHHAPMDAQIKTGDMPHMLAKNSETQDAFWQDKNFRRFMKDVDRANPKLKEKFSEKSALDYATADAVRVAVLKPPIKPVRSGPWLGVG